MGEKVLVERDDDLESNASTMSKSARRRARRKRAKVVKGGIDGTPMISVGGHDPRELDCIPEEIPRDESGPAPKPEQPKRDRPEQLKERTIRIDRSGLEKNSGPLCKSSREGSEKLQRRAHM